MLQETIGTERNDSFADNYKYITMVNTIFD